MENKLELGYKILVQLICWKGFLPSEISEHKRNYSGDTNALEPSALFNGHMVFDIQD